MHTCRVEPIVAWAEAVWDEQLDEAELHKEWRRQQRQVGFRPLWSRVSGPTGAFIMCLRQLGGTWPHDTTFVTASGHEVDLRETLSNGLQGAGKSRQRLGTVEGVGRQRRTERATTTPTAGTSDSGKQARPPSPTRSTCVWAALGVIEAEWWTQEVANKAEASEHPFCLKCEPAVLGSAKHRCWACRAYRETRFDLPPTHQHQGQTATGDKHKWERGLMHK